MIFRIYNSRLVRKPNAGAVGLIPIPVVLSGLASIVLVIGGLSAIILGFGALNKIPGFNDFISGGGELLSNLFVQIGKIAGALVGGFGEGITNSLPKIGANLAGFIGALKPIFPMFAGVDLSGAGAFFGALGSFMLTMGAEKMLSFFTGGTDLDKLGTQLTTFATKSEGFFKKVSSLPANSFENAKLMFNALAGVSGLPKEGGITQWFTGTINWDSLADGLGLLAGEKVIGFFNAVSKIPQTAFEQTKLLFAALSECNGLPKEGGIFQWFSGNSLEGMKSLSEQLPPFGEAVAAFYSSISAISDFSKITELFTALGSIEGNIEKNGGVGTWIKKLVCGGQETGLSSLGSALKQFGSDTSDFFAQVNEINLGNLNGLWESLRNAEGITADSLIKVGEHIDKIVKKATELPQKMGDGIKSAGISLSEALVYIWQEAAKAMSSPVNKVIEGANWILKEFGSDKKIASWQPYAKGTDGHPGGNALVNDGRGAELVQMPNGRTFIPQGRNVFMPNAPKGMKVLPAEQTARLMGKKSPAFHYADGVGNIDLFSYFDNASGLVDEIKKTVSYTGMKGYALHAGKAMVNTITEQMPSWVEKQFEEFGARSLASYVSIAGVEQWESTVAQALKMTGQYSEANVKRTLFQMQTESGGNPQAINLWDSNAKKGIPSKGLMQVIDPTFRAYAMPGFNSNIYDPLSNILASIRYAVSRYGSLARAYQGHGYANGVGTVSLPEQSNGDFSMKYTPETSYTGGRAEVNETNNFTPTFNLTINGATDTRSQERKVKQWIKESMDEMFASMARKTATRTV